MSGFKITLTIMSSSIIEPDFKVSGDEVVCEEQCNSQRSFSSLKRKAGSRPYIPSSAYEPRADGYQYFVDAMNNAFINVCDGNPTKVDLVRYASLRGHEDVERLTKALLVDLLQLQNYVTIKSRKKRNTKVISVEEDVIKEEEPEYNEEKVQ